MRYIQPLSPRTQDELLPAGDWLSQITLCLAPLIVHIFIGIPKAVYLHKKEPRWHDRLGFYNPTTIIWRYMVITDRRARAKSWKAIDMAATNCRFWTDKGWDGSEEMMETSRRFCTRIPHKTHITLISETAAQTIIIIAQGIQAMIDMAGGAQGGWQASIATIFYPLTLFGLLRLPAAFWLTQDASFTSVHSQEAEDELRADPERSSESPASKSSLLLQPVRATGLLLHPRHVVPFEAFPRTNWRGRMVRGFFLVFLLALLGLSMKFVAPYQKLYKISVTSYFQTWMYLFLAASMFIIMGYYCIRHQTTNTIIPCIQSLWYKVYTVFLFFIMITAFGLAAVETRKEACGTYSTYTLSGNCKGGFYMKSYGEVYKDGSFDLDGISGEYLNKSVGALGSIYMGVYIGVSLEDGTTTRLNPFTGWCAGKSQATVNINTTRSISDNSTQPIQSWVNSPNVSIAVTPLPQYVLEKGGVPLKENMYAQL